MSLPHWLEQPPCQSQELPLLARGTLTSHFTLSFVSLPLKDDSTTLPKLYEGNEQMLTKHFSQCPAQTERSIKASFL